MNCKNITKILLVILFGILTGNIYSQEEHHDNDHHKHHHHKYDLGVGNSLVYFPNEKETAYGLHLHLVRNIAHSKFGFGIAYERIFDQHKHNTIGLLASYNPVGGLHIDLSPGVTFEDHEPSELRFAFHAETAYNFDLGNFHLGPMLGFAFDPEDYHIGLGLHVGYGF